MILNKDFFVRKLKFKNIIFFIFKLMDENVVFGCRFSSVVDLEIDVKSDYGLFFLVKYVDSKKFL